MGTVAPTDDLAAPFRFEYDPATLRYGPNCVADLADELAELDCERALVVTGQTDGKTAAVMDPIRTGLGDALGGVFPGTTPEKRLGTAYDALEQYRAADCDAIVAVGGGSSHDVATVLAVLAATDRAPEAVGAELAETGTITVPDADLPPIVTVIVSSIQTLVTSAPLAVSPTPGWMKPLSSLSTKS